MRRALLATAVALSTGVLVSSAPPVLAQPDAPSGPGRYADQTIDWQPCFPDGPPEGLPPGSERLECGSFTAPRDWANPAGGPDITIAVSRLPASDDTAEGALFTNPGGPGGPGRTLPLLFLLADRQRVLDSQDIYGIDVRGTGASTNASCNGGSATGASLDPRDRSPANLDLILDSAQLVAQFCQTATGQFSPFVRTDQTVKDLDLLRHLEGRETINWLGYSGGTWLGAYYATYFPERVGRFVLDANTAFTDPWQTTFDLQPLGFQRRFEVDFLTWAATYDDILDLGASPPAVDRSYEELRAALAAEPLDLGLGVAIYAVDLDALITSAMYSKTSFEPLAEMIRLLRDAVAARESQEGSPLSAAQAEQIRADVRELQQRRAVSGGLQPLAPDALPATFLHITCNDTPWKGDRQSLIESSTEQGQAYPLLGWGTLYNPCVIGWNRPDVTLRNPDGKGVPPVLMVQNDRDPATPIEGARLAHRNFAGSRLLTVTDEGDHTTYASSIPNTCVNQAVEDYLVDGVLPAGDFSCPGTPIPPPEQPSILDALGLDGTPQQRNAELAERAGPLPR